MIVAVLSGKTTVLWIFGPFVVVCINCVVSRVGEKEGDSVGREEGVLVGDTFGEGEGTKDGDIVGAVVGNARGAFVGLLEGELVGASVVKKTFFSFERRGKQKTGNVKPEQSSGRSSQTQVSLHCLGPIHGQ